MIAMDSKSQQFNGSHSLRPRKRPAVDFGLPLDANEDHEPMLADSGSSSRSTSTRSPMSPGDTLLASNGTTDMTADGSDGDSPIEPSTGAHRGKGSRVNMSKLSKDKRKRSRVTPEQLTHLERFFATDRSPTAAKRREISDLLGMHERQTQIWFQNRRAKAKLLDGKKRGVVGEWTEMSPDTPPKLSPGYEDELQQLIHETDPITIIPCSDLSIGTWRRIGATSGKHDLVAYMCENRRCLTWFIHSAGYGFKMEIPFDIITQTDYSTTAPGQSLVSFSLSKPPVFYLETTGSRMGEQIKNWQTCTDWTEGMQATKVLCHDLIGSAVHLTHFLEELHRYRSNAATVPLVTAPIHNRSIPHTPMQIPEPPLLADVEYVDGYRRPTYFSHGRKRSSSDPPTFDDVSSDLDLRNMSSSAPYATTSTYPERRPSVPYLSASQAMTGYDASENRALSMQHQQCIGNYNNVPISQSAQSRHGSFANTSSPQSYPYDTRRPSLYKIDQLQRDSAPPSSHSDYATPSPPLLTMPFQSHSGNGISAQSRLRHSQSSEEIPFTLNQSISRMSASPQDYSHNLKATVI